MDTQKRLFTPQQLNQFQPVLAQSQKEIIGAVFIALILTLLFPMQGLVFALDWEIMFRLFEYLAGDGYQFFSPHLMAFTGILMIIGYHLLASNHPDNIAVKVVTILSKFLILAYALGVGLYLANILFESGIAENADSGLDVLIGGIQEFVQKNWLHSVFEKLAGPLGALSLSIGIGGLGIVCLFISHILLSKITDLVTELFERISRYRTVQEDYKTILRAQEEYSNLSSDLADLDLLDRNYLAHELASETLKEITSNLLPHEEEYQRMLIESNDDSLAAPIRNGDVKEIKKAVDSIKKIDLQHILSTLNTPAIEGK